MEDKSNPNKDRFELQELFLVKADWSRTFMGTLKRQAIGGKPIFRGKVIVNEGRILSACGTMEELYGAMDTLCILKLDHGLHREAGPGFTGAFGEMVLN